MVMNKDRRRDLLQILAKHCRIENKKALRRSEPFKSEFDFVYLPMDFRYVKRDFFYVTVSYIYYPSSILSFCPWISGMLKETSSMLLLAIFMIR